MTADHINSFLASLTGNPEKTRFQFHLKLTYGDYTMDMKQRRRLILLCRQFLNNLKLLVCELQQPTEDNPQLSYQYSELPPNTVFDVPDTGLQSCSDVWKGRRSVVIGASVSHQACHLTERGGKGFLRSVLWNLDGDPTAAMKYGTRMEPLAREAYFKARKALDPSATITFHLGFHINSSFPAGGCSPDGIIRSEINNDILIEMKCPFILKNIDPELFESLLTEAQLDRFPIERDHDGVLQVKKNHKYSYQMQQNMGILNLKEAHLVIFSKFGMIHAEVDFDIELYQEIVTKITCIHKKYLVPEYFEMRVPRDLTPFSLEY
ncbi:Alkaline nuclease [Frankliniella fusca]|uniref:Alkaline nuclease n=1 Tax=Frankliniella fusca TaxID=407009 RepID=A0AAE1HVQ6_9NEOP|nr:Alkaline nuclease [Frankliniella fusca]